MRKEVYVIIVIMLLIPVVSAGIIDDFRDFDSSGNVMKDLAGNDLEASWEFKVL